ncbi:MULTISPECIES: TetR family transcriptional regulator [Thermomonospora]|uniref:Transcriptional regulator, TetR family n=1 Tax=Thermomonospora curvata (strain ATCC 19995 / DSM 43183 / JCM 3096 / KCTC 9072 / NBRC 15933 / NCIMB 10081 / Henssen B9) TaxID=471852 RepID=D1A3Z4_THECD|nr:MULTISPECIES: TetR family transcriptional regulator [Thermomonospora]ACY98047.1 transcriptional regulator, TetR family [Thermomonospora curvata DSM 43183]PKK14322.1 MAG: TetR/AcrR family transcriptional regulator [Thermomonospora sp. CIF 1]
MSTRDPDRRRALLEAADQVIRREGPGASMAAIAAAAGISKPILYRHFGNKSGLYQALAERHTRKLIETIQDRFQRPGSQRERITSTIETYLSMISENLQLYRFLMERASAEDAATHSAMSTMIRGLSQELAKVFMAEVELADPDRAYVWAHAVIGMVQNAGDWWLDHPEVPRRKVVDALADLILVGLPAAAGGRPDGNEG